jgi:predicted nucleotidyltransferase
MGSAVSRTSLAGALFTPVQQRVLALLFGQPERSFQSSEIVRRVGSGTGATLRQLARLHAAGLVTVTRSGNQKHYRARTDSPVFAELRGLVLKTVGLVGPLQEALAKSTAAIRAAFVYGSVAKGRDTVDSDVDLMVISDVLRHADLFEALQQAEDRLGRPVRPTVLSSSEWRKKRAQQDSFVDRVASQPKLFVIGAEDDLA